MDLIVASDAAGTAVQALDLTFPVQAPLTLTILPVPAPPELLPNAPRLQPRGGDRFVADGHLGALTRHLRLLGLDTAYERDADDPRLLEIMALESQILLTRDRRLHDACDHAAGYCPRSDEPEEQAREVLRRFGLLAELERLPALAIGLVEIAVGFLVVGELHLFGIILELLAEFADAQRDVA